MEYNYNKIFDILVSKIPLHPAKNVYGITFIAGPGFGKSTVSKMLSQKLSICVTSNDYIRRLYDELHFDNEIYEPDIKKMANERTQYLLQHKTCMIIDANMEFFWKMAVQNFKNFGAKLYFVELKCSEQTVLNRISERAKDFEKNDNLSRAGLKEFDLYMEKKKASDFPREQIYFSIDMNRSLDQIETQVDELVKKLQSENNV